MGDKGSRRGRRAAGVLGALALLGVLPLLPDGTGADAAPGVVFTNVTEAAGLTNATDPALDPLKGSYTHSVAWGDPNGDGFADMYLGTFTDSDPADYLFRGADGPMPNRLFLNDGAGHFAVAPPAMSDPIATFGRVSGAAFADFDNDGDDDLIVNENRKGFDTGEPPRNQPSRLFRNDAGAALVDVSATAGIPSDYSTGRSTLVRDYDNDGCLDVYLVSDPFLNVGVTKTGRLMKGACNLTFTDVTVAAGLATVTQTGTTMVTQPVQALGGAWGDYDNDGDPDLFLAGGPRNPDGANNLNRFLWYRRNFLFRNDGGTFTEVSNLAFNEAPGAGNGAEDWTSGASWGDLDRDGRLDLVVSHHFNTAMAGTVAKSVKVWLNRTPTGGSPSFLDATTQAGITGLTSKTPHTEIADINNDGLVDIYVSAEVSTATNGPQPLVYVNQGNNGSGIPQFIAPDGFTSTSDIRYFPGAPLVDYDNDGRLDVFGNDYLPANVPPLYRNTGSSGHWLDVVPKMSGRALLGAKVAVYQAGLAGNPAALLFFNESQIGNGFSVASLPIVHAGLGQWAAVDVVITPPFGGTTITLPNVSADRRLVVDVVAPPPVNDELANATVISGPTGGATGSNVGATVEPGEPGTASVWFRWQAPSDGTVTFDHDDVGLLVVRGTPTFDGAPLGGNHVPVAVAAGQELWIGIDSPTPLASVAFTWSHDDGTTSTTIVTPPLGPCEGSPPLLAITLAGNDLGIVRDGDDLYVRTPLGESVCGPIAVDDIALVIVTGSVGPDTFDVDLSGGHLGVVVRAEFDETDRLRLSSGALAARWRAGAAGIDVDEDRRVDIENPGGATLVLLGSPQRDTISAQGGLGTGSAVSSPVDIEGGDKADLLVGGSGPDIISGGPGNDTFRGGLGDDSMHGGDGDDLFDEGPFPNGADLMIGDGGVDAVSYAARINGVTVVLDGQSDDGESGENDNVQVDEVDGGRGHDELIGDDGRNRLVGGPGDDQLHGNGAADVLVGREGADLLAGGDGNDELKGGAGNDVELGGLGDDTFDQEATSNGDDSVQGGEGTDTVAYNGRTSPVTVTLAMTPGTGNDGEADEADDLVGIEEVVGGSAADHLVGASAGESLRGGGGADVLIGGEGIDFLIGNAGDDDLDGGPGRDRLDGGNGTDACNGIDGGDKKTACEGVAT